jgi:hypothetical protein
MEKAKKLIFKSKIYIQNEISRAENIISSECEDHKTLIVSTTDVLMAIICSQDQVLERLAAAYSLEKMRQALVEFRSSMKGHPYNKRCV